MDSPLEGLVSTAQIDGVLVDLLAIATEDLILTIIARTAILEAATNALDNS